MWNAVTFGSSPAALSVCLYRLNEGRYSAATAPLKDLTSCLSQVRNQCLSIAEHFAIPEDVHLELNGIVFFSGDATLARMVNSDVISSARDPRAVL